MFQLVERMTVLNKLYRQNMIRKMNSLTSFSIKLS